MIGGFIPGEVVWSATGVLAAAVVFLARAIAKNSERIARLEERARLEDVHRERRE